jgi:hypothetical protein
VFEPGNVKIKIKGDQYLIPRGNNVNLINPYNANFNNIPASITEPGVDASV